MDFENAVAVVTGAGSGIGRECTPSQRGARVVVTDVNEERGTVAAEIGDRAAGLRCDVTELPDLDAYLDRCATEEP